MQTKMFPSAFNTQSDRVMNSLMDEAELKYNETINSINNSHKSPPELSKYVKNGTVISMVIGAFCCIGVSSYNAGGAGLFYWGIITIFGAIIGVLIWKSAKKAYNRYESDLESRISQEIENYNTKIANIINQSEKDQRNYLTSFEKNAQDMSVQLADSELAQKVIHWMTEGFSRTIDAADRRKHIEQINVPFSFNVYTDKITCNLGTFDFEVERCEFLDNPVEQTALARAIASSIQLNIVMKYPKDASGTDIQIKIEYQYTDKCPKTTITYVALNGNYEAVQKW